MAAKRKYRWEEWFAAPRTVLVRGVDYHCSQSALCGTIRNNASRRGLRVRLTDTGNTVIIEVMGAVYHPDPTPVAS